MSSANSTVVSTTSQVSSSSSAAPSSSSATTTTTTTPPSSSIVSSSSTTTTSSSSSSPPSTTSSATSSPVDTTSVTTASSVPPSTAVITSVVTATGDGQSSGAVTTIIITSGPNGSATTGTLTSSTGTSSSSAPALTQGNSSDGSGGLNTQGKTAIAVVVPVVAVALLVLGALFFWRKRKQRKAAEEARRKEVEEYGYNPNTNPTLPALATDGHSEMAEDSTAGYRGWGVGKSSNRQPSTTLSGGHTQGQPSDAGSNNGGFSTTPTAFNGSEGYGSDNYTKQRDTMNSDDLAALGSAPATKRGDNMRRGPSNASSSYSAGHRSENSDPSIGHHPTSESVPQGYGYGQSGPYGDGSYGGGDGMPVVRDVSARRNTRIEQGGAYQQGNSGIAQNF